MTVSGPFSIGDDGLIDADLKITIRDPKGLSAVLAEAFPEERRQIGSGFSALAVHGQRADGAADDRQGPGDARLHPARPTYAADPR